MNDSELLKHYLSLREREAYQWNLSPRSLYLELESRDFLQRHYHPIDNTSVCNVGIGVGEWDDFLGFFIHGFGHLTSIDIDSEICEMFKYRQQREGHINPAQVVCEDFTCCSLPFDTFDLVTFIGSTLSQMNKSKEALHKTHEILKPDGKLFIMNFHHSISLDQMTELLMSAGFKVEVVEEFVRYPSVKFYCLLSKKS